MIPVDVKNMVVEAVFHNFLDTIVEISPILDTNTFGSVCVGENAQ